MKRSKLLLFLTLAAIVVYLLGLLVDQTSDAAKYAAIGRNILQSHDWINLKIGGEPYDQKPPLLFWLAAVSFKLFGFSNLAYKLPSFLMSLFGVFATFRLGKVLYNEKVGKLAAIMLFFSEVYFLYNMDVHTDALLASTTAIALWQFAEYLKERKLWNMIFGFIATGLAMMSKGPVGLAVVAFAVGIQIVSHRKMWTLINWKWLLGIPILALMISPALKGLYDQFGWNGIIFYFWKNNAGRITGDYVGSNSDYSFYFHTLLYLFLPWSFFALTALILEWRDLIRKRFKLEGREVFLIGAITLYWIIISIAKGKAPHYLFVVIPMLSVLTAKWMIVLYEKQKYHNLGQFLYRFQQVCIILLWIATLIISLYLFPMRQPIYWFFIVILLILSVFSFWEKNRYYKTGLLSIAVIIVLSFSINSNLMPGIFRYESSIQACETFNKQSVPGDHLWNYRYGLYEVYFYAKDGGRNLSDSTQLEKVCFTPGTWMYTDSLGYKEIVDTKAPIRGIYMFQHRYVSNPSLKFILPKTRMKQLTPMYLIRL